MTTPLAEAPEHPGRARAPGPSRLAELALTGGLTPLLFPLSWLLRRAIGLDAADLAVGFTFFHAAHVINDPHFAVTYVLFYEDARGRALGPSFSGWQRARYVAAGLVAPVALLAFCAVALVTRSAALLGGLMSLMFFLVGWHYVKQGFGVMIALSARRGVRYTPRERLALLAHCFTGWAYAWASPADPGTEVVEKGVVFTTIARGPGLERATHALFLASIVPVVWVLVQKRRREGRLPVAVPLGALLASVWAWSIYSGVDPLVRYMNPALHSVQYLFMVYLLKGGEAREREGAPWFELAARTRLGLLAASALGLGWLLFHGAPAALDGALAGKALRRSLGPTPFFAALYACVNIHHYVMDAVIWRRENALTRYLVDAPDRTAPPG